MTEPRKAITEPRKVMTEPRGTLTEARADLVSGWPARQAARLVQLGSRHPRAVELAVCLVIAAASVIGLAVQHRLTPVTLAFCAGLCGPLLLHRHSAIATFGAIAAVALAQWLTSGPQLADAALLVAFYWVALEGSLAELGVAAATLELGAVLAALRWSSEPVKIWIGLVGSGGRLGWPGCHDPSTSGAAGVAAGAGRETRIRARPGGTPRGGRGAGPDCTGDARHRGPQPERDDRAGRGRELHDGDQPGAGRPGGAADLDDRPRGAPRDAPVARGPARRYGLPAARAPAGARPAGRSPGARAGSRRGGHDGAFREPG